MGWIVPNGQQRGFRWFKFSFKNLQEGRYFSFVVKLILRSSRKGQGGIDLKMEFWGHWRGPTLQLRKQVVAKGSEIGNDV